MSSWDGLVWAFRGRVTRRASLSIRARWKPRGQQIKGRMAEQ